MLYKRHVLKLQKYNKHEYVSLSTQDPSARCSVAKF